MLKLHALIILGISALLSPLLAAQPNSFESDAKQAAAKVELAKKLKPNRKRARNVILFVGDGMGISTITAARILEGQKRGETGEENQLSFERFPYLALSKTYNTNQQTPDSAGTMTAMIAGVKTKAGFLSLPPTIERGECAPDTPKLTTFLELAEQAGKATGIVSTAAITHATPAATYAHTSERNWLADSTMPAAAIAKGCKDIAQQLVEFSYGDGIDVILGGGRRDFLPNTSIDGEAVAGRRADGQDLTEKWLSQSDARDFVWNSEQLNDLGVGDKRQVLGLFNPSHMQFELDRQNDVGGEPSLADMTNFAIDKLANRSGKKGYFLMVEAGRIDHGHHLGNARRALEDTIAFSDAVAAAVAKVDLDNTLIIVTADHSHVMTMAGYPTRGNPILGYVRNNQTDGNPAADHAVDLDGKPYTTLGYANGLGAHQSCDDSPHERLSPSSLDYKQAATYPLYSETHGGEDVAIFAAGAGAYLVHGAQEQNIIFHIMKAAAKL